MADEARPDSDIDLMVEEDFRLRRELIGTAFDMLLETGEDISIEKPEDTIHFHFML